MLLGLQLYSIGESMVGIYSTQEVARRLGIHHYSVCRIIRRGWLRAHMIGRTWVVEEGDLDDLAKSYEGRPGRPRKKARRRRHA